MQVDTETHEETHALGVRLGKLLRPGDVLLLHGELGSGKTVLAQGIGQGLEVAEPVTSSSYVLMTEYGGRLDLYHADLFRLDDPAQVADLALEEIASAGVLVVEWPERAWDELPVDHLLVRIEETADEDAGQGRRFTLTPRGERYDELLAALGEPAVDSESGRD